MTDKHLQTGRKAIAMTSDRGFAIARRAAELDAQLERLLDSNGKLCAAMATTCLSSAQQRTVRVERLRESMEKATALPDAARLWHEAEALRWELALSAWHLAENEARRVRIPELSKDDIMGEAAVGLYEAAKRFDPDLGFQFTTYARWWIRAQTKMAVNAAHRIVRLPDSARRQRARLLRTETVLDTAAAARPNATVVAAVAGIRSSRASFLLSSFSSVSWQHVARLGGHPLEEITADPSIQSADSCMTLAEDLELATDGLRRSDEGVHKRIVIARFGLGGDEPKTLGELSQKIGVSRERVRQLEREALDALKEGIERAHALPTCGVRLPLCA